MRIGLLVYSILISFEASAQNDDWTKRDEWQNVAGIFYAMGIDSASIVADIGCQEGYLTLRLAPRVARVFAVDIDVDALRKLKNNASEFNNITTVHGDVDDPKLPSDTLDAAVIVNAYHEMTAYVPMLAHVYRALKPKGRLVIVEPISQSLRSAERSKQTKAHEIGIAYVRKDLLESGFTIIGEQDPFVKRDHRNDEMWIIVSEKPE
jgi:SAM-dependent methyltransferase